MTRRLLHLNMLTALADFFPETVTITDPGTVTTTSSGGTTVASPVSTADVPARLAPPGTQSVIETFGAQLVSQAQWVMLVASTVAIQAGWTVTVSGTAYPVIAVAPAESNAVTQRALLGKRTAIGG